MVARINEQRPIAVMRFDVIDHGSGNRSAARFAELAKRR
jgi:hypothetical protein